jgi:hypothetical protein
VAVDLAGEVSLEAAANLSEGAPGLFHSEVVGVSVAARR